MIDRRGPHSDDLGAEVKNLILTLHETERRLAEIAGDGVDGVLHPGGASYLLHRAQGQLRDSEAEQRDLAERQSAILNAFPAQIALLDAQGIIVSVNNAWRRAVGESTGQRIAYGIGQNYFDICEDAVGFDAADARKAADGIRKTLSGTLDEFAFDYSLHSDKTRRWFRLLVSPVKQVGSGGAVVAHIDITERKLLEESANRRSLRLAALVEAQRQLSSIADMGEFIEQALAAAQRLTDADGADFEELAGEELVYRATSGVAPGHKGLRLSVRSSLAGQAILEGHTLRCDDAQTDLRVSKVLRDTGMRSMVAAIIRNGDHATGVLRVVSIEPNRFDDEQAKTLELFAEWFGTVLQRKEHANEIRIRAEQQAAIAKLSQQALVGGRFSELLDNAVALIARTLNVEKSIVMRLMPNGQSIQFAAGVGWAADIEKIVVPVGRHTVSGYTLMSAEPIIVEDMAADERFKGMEIIQRHKIVSGISAVIQGEDTPWGSLGAFTTVRRNFSFQDTVFIQSVANLIAQADRRHRGEEALARQAELLDKANDAIVVCDLDFRIRFWNKGAERLFGWTREEAIGSVKSELLQDASIDFERRLEEVSISGNWSGVVKRRRKDGSDVTVRVRWTLIRNSENEPESIFSILTDITEQIALEHQLRQAQRLEAVGELTGGIAHDFNNLLTVILGNSELLIELLEDNDDLRMLAETNLSAAKRGADLTHRLLAFSRRQPLAPKVVDINNLVQDIEPLIRRAITADIGLEVIGAENLWLSLVDPSQLESAILNLCINARDAMPNGGRISIETANRIIDADLALEQNVISGDYVMVSVSDTGTGIPKDNLDRIFDPFFTTKDVGKGTGLGLSMVYGFIKQSRGTIKVYSELGKGTTFKMFLPRSSGVVALRDSAETSPVDLGGSERILLVEDDELVRSQAARQLISLGYHVTTASDGPTALEIIKGKDDFDLLFTDIVMPGGINGRNLADKSISIRPGLKVLFTSGYTENILLREGRLDDGTLLLSKPYSRAELAQKVREALDAICQMPAS